MSVGSGQLHSVCDLHHVLKPVEHVGITACWWEGGTLGTPMVLGNSEGCMRVASLLVEVWERNTKQSICREGMPRTTAQAAQDLQTRPHQDTAGTPWDSPAELPGSSLPEGLGVGGRSEARWACTRCSAVGRHRGEGCSAIIAGCDLLVLRMVVSCACF